MKRKNKHYDFKDLSKMLGLIIGISGIIIQFWDTLTAIYFISVGMWLYLICGDKNG